MDTTVWASVANSSIARVLERSSAEPAHWQEVECLVHPQSRLQGAAAGHEPPGHSIAGRSGLASRSEPQEHERREFAQQIAQVLKAAVGAHRVGRIAVFASHPFLGELLAHLDDEVRKRVSDHHALDLTGLGLQALAQRLHGEFRL